MGSRHGTHIDFTEELLEPITFVLLVEGLENILSITLVSVWLTEDTYLELRILFLVNLNPFNGVCHNSRMILSVGFLGVGLGE